MSTILRVLVPSPFFASSCQTCWLNMQQSKFIVAYGWSSSLLIGPIGTRKQALINAAICHQKTREALRVFSITDTLFQSLLAVSCKESGAWLHAVPIVIQNVCKKLSMKLHLGPHLCRSDIQRKYSHLDSCHSFTPGVIDIVGPKTNLFVLKIRAII